MECAQCFQGALGSVSSVFSSHHPCQKISKRARMFAQRNSPATPRQTMFLSRMKGPQRRFKDDYSRGQCIGAGSFGEVFEATKKNNLLSDSTNALCAVKMMSIKDQERDVLARELHSLISLNHPHVLALHAWYETSTQLLVVTELCVGGTLADKPCPSPASVLVPIFHGIFSALAYSHARGIVHRDIKPANVLFTADGTVKLGDWGLSTHIEGEDATACGGQGTIFYVAPEVVTPPFTTSFSSDIWSAGVILFMYLHNYHPYMVMSQRSPSSYRSALRNGVVMQTMRPDLDDTLATLLLRCLHTDATERPSAAECWRSDALKPTTSPSTSSHAARIIRDYSRCRKEEPRFVTHENCDDYGPVFLDLANDAGVVVGEGDIMIEYSEFVLAMTDEFADIPARTRFHFEAPEGGSAWRDRCGRVIRAGDFRDTAVARAVLIPFVLALLLWCAVLRLIAHVLCRLLKSFVFLCFNAFVICAHVPLSFLIALWSAAHVVCRPLQRIMFFFFSVFVTCAHVSLFLFFVLRSVAHAVFRFLKRLAFSFCWVKSAW